MDDLWGLPLPDNYDDFMKRREADGAFSCYDLEVRRQLGDLNVPIVVKFGSVDEVIGVAIEVLERRF